MSHYEDCLYAAVSALAAHGPIKQRLTMAYERYLDSIEEKEVPVEGQKSFNELQGLMHGVTPANGEGPICASVRKMSKIEADKCAQLIVDIYGAAMQRAKTAKKSLPRATKTRPSVPPFLVKSGQSARTG